MCRAYKRAYYRRNPESWRKYDLKLKYGISPDTYWQMMADQNNCCAICGKAADLKKRAPLAVDHCHTHGTIRGLLCLQCNTSLGWYKRESGRVTSYLESHTHGKAPRRVA